MKLSTKLDKIGEVISSHFSAILAVITLVAILASIAMLAAGLLAGREAERRSVDRANQAVERVVENQNRNTELLERLIIRQKNQIAFMECLMEEHHAGITESKCRKTVKPLTRDIK